MTVAASIVRALSASEVATPDNDLTEDHMRLILWLDAHPTGSLAAAAQALGLVITEVERLCADLVASEMLEWGHPLA